MIRLIKVAPKKKRLLGRMCWVKRQRMYVGFMSLEKSSSEKCYGRYLDRIIWVVKY